MSAISHPCAHCGMPLNYAPGQQISVCIACGRTNSRPKATGECLNYLQRANRLRDDKEYALATECYTYVLHQHPDEAEALWGRVLSLYGIEFATDPKTGKRHILMHFPRPKPFVEQSDYRAACAAAAASVRAQYEDDARYITAAQQRIHELAQTAQPYDIFLCFKETQLHSSEKTEDYRLAQQIYQQFNGQYRVFFSPVELNKTAAGANYEAAIYHALATSRLMIVVGTRPAHMMATWPQSEWTRFLEWYDGDHSTPAGEKRLIPLFQGMSREELPFAFRVRGLQDIDWSQKGAADRLQQAVREFLGTPTKPVPAKTAPPQAAPATAKSSKPAAPAKKAPAPTRTKTPFQQDLEAANSGDADAQYRLAMTFQERGDTLPENRTATVRWFLAAAKQGHADAQFEFGRICDKGVLVKQDLPMAVEWYRAAAMQGHAGAQNSLGNCYDKGDGVTQDKHEAARWYQLSADQGNVRALTNLARLYENGQGVIEDKAKAARLYRAAAEQGFARAQYNLACMYDNDEGVTADPYEAEKWYLAAANQGHINAQYNLAYLYEDDYSPLYNPEAAHKWYLAAANQGDAGAQCNLGILYYNGTGVPQNKREAHKWYLAAAKQGNANAQCNLGYMYEDGDSVPMNKSEALKWYKLAAEQGHDRAQCALGRMYASRDARNRHEAAHNRREAIRWYQLAADQGNSEAETELLFL